MFGVRAVIALSAHSSSDLAIHASVRRRTRGRTELRSRLPSTNRALRMPIVSGGYIEKAIPDPIPNSEVKLFGADGTAWGICVGE